MRTPISLVIVISLLALQASAIGRTRKVTSSRGSGESIVAHLNTLTAEQLHRICNQQIVTKGEPFFHNWVIQTVLNQPFNQPAQVAGNVHAQVAQHLEQLNKYIATMTEMSKDLAKYSRFYFDANIKDLNARTYDILKMDFQNVYDTREKLNELTPKVGPYAENLVQEIANRDVTPLEIQKIGTVYEKEDRNPEQPLDLELKGLVEENKPQIKKALYEIIAVFTNTDPHKLYPSISLDKEKMDFLQTYFNAFKYLLDPVEHHRAVLKALTGTPLEAAVKQHPFVNEDLFKYFQGLNTPFKPVFFRDNFIAEFNPDYALEDLHAAAEPAFFSWDFFKAFNPANYKDARDPSIEDQKVETELAKLNRKIARLHGMLYKVYTLARDDNTLPANPKFNPEDNQVILRKLYTWVKDNAPLFAIPNETEEGLINPGQKLHTLFEPITFRRYYLPLLDLICQKIDGCDILRDDKAEVVKTFVDFGIHDDLKDKALIKKLITPKLLEDITHDAAVKELKDFGDKVEDLIEKMAVDVPLLFEEEAFPDDFEQKEETKKTGKKNLIKKKLNPPKTYGNLPIELTRKDSNEPVSPTISPKKSVKDLKENEEDEEADTKIDKVVPLTPKELQDTFDNTIGKRFLPDDNEPEEETKKVVQLTKFLDSVEAIENPRKKRKIRHLLMNFIVKSHSKPLVDKFVDHKMKQLRSPVDFGNSVAFRNFLFRSMNEQGRYVPTTADDEYNYGLDVLFYIIYASKDYALHLKETQSPLLKTEGPKILAQLSLVNKDFVQAPPVGLKGEAIQRFQNARSALMKGQLDEKFLERSSGVEFFRHFLDFFDYYEVVEKEAKSVNVDYYRVFLQFYQILAHLRRGDIQAFENPHEYVLLKIQECMVITEYQESIVPLAGLESHCVFSYRKYAEVLYFYKMYLLQTNKQVGRALLEFEHEFDVHTRLFINFAFHNTKWMDILDVNCKANPDLHSICTSWNTFKAVVTYVRTEDMPESQLAQELAPLATGSSSSKINVFNGFEAAHLFSRTANNVINYKFNSIFATEGVNSNDGVAKMLKFEDDDQDALALYLLRTYKKLTLEPKELKIFDFVAKVLSTPETGEVHSDVLIGYLYFIDRVAPFYVKLFLQYAQTNEHFARLARVLIKNDISTNLIAINDPAKDEFFRRVVSTIHNTPQVQVADKVFEMFQEEYAATLKQCSSVAASQIMDFLNDAAFLDALGGVDSLQAETSEKKVENLGKEVVSILKTIETRVQIAEGDNVEDLLRKHEDKLRSEIHLEEDERLSIEVQDYYVVTDSEEDDEEEDGEEEAEDMPFPFERQVSMEISNSMTNQLNRNLDNMARNPGQIEQPVVNARPNLPVNEGLARARNRIQQLRNNRLRVQRPKRRIRLGSKDKRARMENDRVDMILKNARKQNLLNKPKVNKHKVVV